MSIRTERPSAVPGCAETVPASPLGGDTPAVAVVRTPRGWSVVGPGGPEPVDCLLEGLSLADLIGEGLGQPLEPDRAARRSARGPAGGAAEAEDPRDARIAALERTVAQLEHALAARVATERALGVLAERQGTSPRAAFEGLRQQARSTGRPVHELAHEVLGSLPDAPAFPFPTSDRCVPDQASPPPGLVVSGVPAPGPRPRSTHERRVEQAWPRSGAAGDGRS